MEDVPDMSHETCLNSPEVRTYGAKADGPNKFVGYPGVSSGNP